jgi:hypothetical protein
MVTAFLTLDTEAGPQVTDIAFKSKIVMPDAPHQHTLQLKLKRPFRRWSMQLLYTDLSGFLSYNTSIDDNGSMIDETPWDTRSFQYQLRSLWIHVRIFFGRFRP